MANVDLFSVIPVQTNIFSAYLNTGTLLDLACGAIEQTEHNLAINGGISNILGIGGKSQTYKSSLMDGLVARAMSIYPDMQAIIFDSENNKTSTERYNDFAINGVKPSSRIALFDTTTDDLNSIHDKIKTIVEHKKKYAKDIMVPTPFLDNQGKPISIMQPTLCMIDSFTIAGVNSESDSIEKSDLDASDLNTIWMKSGKHKTLFMRQIVQYARSANIYFILTAHIGETKDIGGNPYMQPKKQLQFMAQKDRLKNVGSQFEFLTNTFLQTSGVNVLKDNNNLCMYPSEISNPSELNRVNVVVVRNKINASGTIVPFVISQYEGLMNTLTHLQYLKDQKEDKLLIQKVGNMQSALYPDVIFTRNNIRKKTEEDYRLERALELSAQLIFVKNCWSSYKLPVDTSISVERFISKLLEHKTELTDDILNSRSYWTYNKNDKRPMLTIFDVLEMISQDKFSLKISEKAKATRKADQKNG